MESQIALTHLKFWGHAFFSLAQNGETLAIDPYLAQGPIPSSFCPTLICVTHGHGDHLGEAIPLSQRTAAPILAVSELARYCKAQGADVRPAQPGGRVAFPFGWVELVPAIHGSSGPQGEYLGVATGLLIEWFGRVFYHAGDTALFSDMAQFKRKGPIFAAMLPIGGLYTMGPEDALAAVKLLEPEIVIPMHYGTFAAIAQDVHAFGQRVEQETNSRCLVLEHGQENTI